MTSRTGSLINSAAVAPGESVVALANITVGALAYRAHNRNSRRSTIATWEPKTPR